MYYASHSRKINKVLLALIVLAALIVVGWIGYNTGLTAGEGTIPAKARYPVIANASEVILVPISLAENAGLSRVSGIASLDKLGGRLTVDVVLPEGSLVPEGAVLEAWLVDAGQDGGLGRTSSSAQDEVYGTPFANTDFAAKAASAPYALALGKLMFDEERESWYLFYEVNNNLTPYDAVMVTVEADGSGEDYDPRPGTPVLVGEIK